MDETKQEDIVDAKEAKPKQKSKDAEVPTSDTVAGGRIPEDVKQRNRDASK